MGWFMFYTLMFATGLSPSAHEYATLEFNNQIWLAENLSCFTFESFCYDDDQRLCEDYGRLYTWESAQLACTCLGEDWRLPTIDDWQGLINHFGGSYDGSKGSGEKAFKALSSKGHSGFEAKPGGMINLNPSSVKDRDFFSGLKVNAFYWTGTEKDNAEVWYYAFSGTSRTLFRYYGKKTAAYSVRCVKDVPRQ